MSKRKLRKEQLRKEKLAWYLLDKALSTYKYQKKVLSVDEVADAYIEILKKL